MTAYYNEIDPYAAQWLRNLIEAGHIAPGIVDERSIEDVLPSDLGGFTQCHFFAGIGVWSLALRRSGWPDDRPIWTGSCPCQPFSAAGKGAGFDDERHLWPSWHWLIQQCRPPVILGEQVASKDADPWIDLVQADLEGMDYAFGAIPFPAAGIRGAHIRDRLYWMANANDTRLQGRTGMQERAFERASRSGSLASRMADDTPSGRGKECAHVGGSFAGSGAQGFAAGSLPSSADCRLADADGARPFSSTRRGIYCSEESARPRNGELERSSATGSNESACALDGRWDHADWLRCRDGKWRPVEPGTFPLAHGAPARVGRLRAYGNAIDAKAAQVWIESVMEFLHDGC